MSFTIMGLMMRHGPSDLKAWAVAMALADFANDDGTCWPAVDSVASRARHSRASAFRALKELEKDQWIQRAKRTTASGRGSNYYRINVMRLLNAGRAEAVDAGVHPDFDPFPEEVAAGLAGGSQAETNPSQAETNPVSGGDEPRLPVRREAINEAINEASQVSLAEFSVGALSPRARSAWRDAINVSLDVEVRRAGVAVLRSEGIGPHVISDDGRLCIGGKVKPPVNARPKGPRSGSRGFAKVLG